MLNSRTEQLHSLVQLCGHPWIGCISDLNKLYQCRLFNLFVSYQSTFTFSTFLLSTISYLAISYSTIAFLTLGLSTSSFSTFILFVYLFIFDLLIFDLLVFDLSIFNHLIFDFLFLSQEDIKLQTPATRPILCEKKRHVAQSRIYDMSYIVYSLYTTQHEMSYIMGLLPHIWVA